MINIAIAHDAWSDRAQFVEAKLSSKILAQAREQQDAIDAEDDLDQWEDEPAAPAKGAPRVDSDDDDDVAHGEEAKFDGDQQHFFSELVCERQRLCAHDKLCRTLRRKMSERSSCSCRRRCRSG